MQHNAHVIRYLRTELKELLLLLDQLSTRQDLPFDYLEAYEDEADDVQDRLKQEQATV